MARNTEISAGKHLIKPWSSRGVITVAIPRQLAAQAGIDGSMFVGAMAVGKCVVIAQVNRVNGTEFSDELAAVFTRALREWESRKNV